MERSQALATVSARGRSAAAVFFVGGRWCLAGSNCDLGGALDGKHHRNQLDAAKTAVWSV